MKQALIATILVLMLGGGAVSYFMSTRSLESESTHPLDNERHWICLDQNDPHDFTTTVREMAQYTDGIICPTCSSENVMSALKCPSCSRHYPAGRYNASPTNCMHCDAELPGGDISTFHGSEGH